MKKRSFLKALGGLAAGAALPPIKPTEYDDWMVHYCQSGSTLGVNLEYAKQLAKKHRKDVIFEFNYDAFYWVKPDGTWSERKRPQMEDERRFAGKAEDYYS